MLASHGKKYAGIDRVAGGTSLGETRRQAMTLKDEEEHHGHGAAVAAYERAARRDPRIASFGYLAADPATGAVAPFLWFATFGEMLEFLQTAEVALLRFDEADRRRVTASLARAVAGRRSVGRLDRERLTAAFEGWSEVLWLGTFAELCATGGTLPTGVRAAFRRAHDLGEHAGPIGDGEIAAFVAFLRMALDPDPDV